MRHLEWSERSAPQALPAYGAQPAGVHVFDRPSVDAIHAALAAGRPLLVRGEPGSGKSQLARAAAAALGRAFVSHVIDARTEARDLMWSFDAVSRLAEAQIQGALGVTEPAAVRENLKEERFLSPGPLWWAFDWADAARQAKQMGSFEPAAPECWEQAEGVVLLLDEIDKADSSVPNGLLECLGQGQFSCPGGRTVRWKPQEPPLIVVTTNEERSLPDPFLRRCMVLHLGLPEAPEALIAELVGRGQAHFPSCSPRVLEAVARQLESDRREVAARDLTPPGGAEFIDLVRALLSLAPDDEAEQLRLLGRIARFALRKHPTELHS